MTNYYIAAEIYKKCWIRPRGDETVWVSSNIKGEKLEIYWTQRDIKLLTNAFDVTGQLVIQLV